MLKKSTRSFLTILLQSGEMDIEKVMMLLERTKKQFWYELSVVNEDLAFHDLSSIQVKDGKISIRTEARIEIEKLIRERSIELYKIQEERVYFLYLYIACRQEFLSNMHLQQFLQLSRNAVMLDLKKLRKWIEGYAVFVEYDRKNGYLLRGSERDIRKLMEKALSKLKHTFPLDDVLFVFEKEWSKKSELDAINRFVIELSRTNQLNMVYDRMEEFIYLLVFIKNRKEKRELNFTEEERDLLSGQSLFSVAQQLVKEVFQTADQCEIFFWESRLLGIIQGKRQISNQPYFDFITENVLMNISTMVGVEYSQLQDLKVTLYQHIVPAYFRIKFNVYYHNPLLEKIQNEYRELFEITRRALRPLEKEVGHTISDSEVAYFTIHFGGYLKKREDRRPLKAIVVCPNGISSSLIMASTIRETFPELEIIRAHSMDNIEEALPKTIDIIFSTTYFPTDKKMYVTSPVLNPVEREVLREQVSKDFPELPKSQPILASDLLKMMKKYGTVKDKQGLLNELQGYLYQTDKMEEKGMRNLPNILTESLVRVLNHVLDWREAIGKAAEPLLEQDYIEEEYIEAMIETVENIGPYIVLAPKVAVPHARPERGVKKLGISLLKLDQPVDFNVNNEKDPERYVQLIFVLAAVDGEAHLKALMQLSKILEDEEHIEELIALNEPKALYDRIQYLVEQEGGA